MNSIKNSRASAPHFPQLKKPEFPVAILKALACALAASSLLAPGAIAASSSSSSGYDVIDVGSDPTQDDGAITITEDDDSISLHMGGDPSHGIYHNPSQQNEYVYPPDDWRCGGDRHNGGWSGQEPRGGYSNDRKEGYGHGWDEDRGYDHDGGDGGYRHEMPRQRRAQPAGNGSGRCRGGDPRDCH